MATPKQLIRYWVPQGLRDIYNLVSGSAIRFKGVFDKWEDAERVADGYDDGSLFQRIESAALAVRNGRAAWEQDGVTHDMIPPDFPLLACLSLVALAYRRELTVLDFGGGFGSSFHQARAYLTGVQGLHWHIVEQPLIVASGRRHFQTDELHFHDSIDACLAETEPNVVLLSSVLQYLPNPYMLLERLAAETIEFLIIDRHPRTMTRELITIQKIPRSLYPASYPSWLFDTGKMDAVLSSSYDKQMEWAGKDPPIRGRGIGARYVGEFWKRRRA